jgi:hypothetical protein
MLLSFRVSILLSTRGKQQVLGRMNFLLSKSESKSKLLYDWGFTANKIVLVSSPLRLTTKDLLFFELGPLQ